MSNQSQGSLHYDSDKCPASDQPFMTKIIKNLPESFTTGPLKKEAKNYM